MAARREENGREENGRPDLVAAWLLAARPRSLADLGQAIARADEVSDQAEVTLAARTVLCCKGFEEYSWDAWANDAEDNADTAVVLLRPIAGEGPARREVRRSDPGVGCLTLGDRWTASARDSPFPYVAPPGNAVAIAELRLGLRYGLIRADCVEGIEHMASTPVWPPPVPVHPSRWWADPWSAAAPCRQHCPPPWAGPRKHGHGWRRSWRR